jgi:hypothetical protein
MDHEWRTRLAAELLGPREVEPESERDTFAPEGATAMEIAFGKARSELTYVLELGRSHQLPVAGTVIGDTVWVRLGEVELRFILDRATTTIASRVLGKDEMLAWDAKQRAIATGSGKLVDVEFFVREAIDATVKAYKSGQAKAGSQS